MKVSPVSRSYEVLMDSFIKRSQRNKLWAHARNKTTEKLLVGTLQHLSEEYDRECRHYLRNRHRIQRELVELRSLTEDFNIANSKDKGKVLGTVAVCRRAPNIVAKSQQIKEPEENRPIGDDSSRHSGAVWNVIKNGESPVLEENRNKLFVKGDEFDDRKDTLDSDLSRSFKPIKISRPQFIDFNKNTSFFTDKSRSLTLQEVERAMPRHGHVCKYKEGQKGGAPCPHFPCQIPRTYHSLGYRRDDLIPWLREARDGDITFREARDGDITFHEARDGDITFHKTRDGDITFHEARDGDITFHEARDGDFTFRDARDGDFKFQSTTDKPSTKLPKHVQLHKVTASEYLDNVPTSSQHDDSLPSWRKNSLKLNVQFQPKEGPIFTAKPSDPILEQIRSGSLEQIQGKPSMTRKTVSAKLRGLKQLVVEMKYRNDLTKPADWAVNYGARLPTRVLLNPVFPV